MSLARKVVPPLLALAFGIALGATLLEGLVRLAGHRRRHVSTKIEAHYTAPWSRPDYRPIPEPGSGPVFRIVVVGDSFTWGDGVLAEDAYPHRLEHLLWARHLPVRVEMHVISRPGWSSADEASALAARWPGIEPDLLIVGYVLNDPLPPPGAANEALREPTRRRRPAPGLSIWLYRHSFLFDLVWDRLENTRQRNAFREHYETLHDPDEPGWKRARYALRSMQKLAAADSVPAVLAIFPVFDFENWDDYAYADIHRLVRHVGKGMGYEVLDLLPIYRGVDGVRLPVVPFTDAHPNELAHRMAAQALADFIIEEKLVPTEAPEAVGSGTPSPAQP
ncbi:MAG: SGNH/GDSL hydrolase family protein [Thermoanaerobaculia bacterium]